MCAVCTLQDALAASFKAGDAAEVTSITRGLLEKLDDPYTRLLQEEEDAALTAEEEGKVGGANQARRLRTCPSLLCFDSLQLVGMLAESSSIPSSSTPPPCARTKAPEGHTTT